MRGASVCFFKQLPFTFNMVLTRDNRGEIDDMVNLAAKLGSRGVRFGHLMLTPENTANSPALSPAERREVEEHIWDLRKNAPVFVDIAPGYYSESPFFPCGPLELEEYNLDYKGNLTLCCHLSGYAGPNAGDDIMGNLHDISLIDACRRFQTRVATYLADKRARVNQGTFGELDHFPCWDLCEGPWEKCTRRTTSPAPRGGRQMMEPANRMEGDCMSSQGHVRPDPEVVDTDIDEGEVALLHLGTKTYFSLNVTGALIWRHLKQGLSLDDVSSRLQAEFDVDRAQADRSVNQLVDELVRNNLAQRV